MTGLEWLEQSIAWDKAHPFRYKLRRVRHHVRHPVKAYRHAVYWPVRTFVERGRRGWSVSDTWGFDTYTARVMGEALTYFGEHLNGYPVGVHASTAIQALDLEPDGEGQQEWKAIIDEMADGFRAWAERDDLSAEAEAEAYRRVRKSIRLMHRWFGHLWD